MNNSVLFKHPDCDMGKYLSLSCPQSFEQPDLFAKHWSSQKEWADPESQWLDFR